MKKLALAVLAASSLLATPALAATSGTPVSGTVNLTGAVGTKCTVGGGATISDAKNFGELADANGNLVTGLSASFDHSLVCNGSAVTVAISAAPAMANTAIAPTGYTNQVGYTVAVAADAADGSTATATAITGTTTLPTAATTATYLKAGTGNNLHITVSNLNASGTLVAGNYAATVTYSVTPSA